RFVRHLIHGTAKLSLRKLVLKKNHPYETQLRRTFVNISFTQDLTQLFPRANFRRTARYNVV
ncbi:MAG: hypothetical protein AAFW87_12055, partial [Pseudomonadota bacterium]